MKSYLKYSGEKKNSIRSVESETDERSNQDANEETRPERIIQNRLYTKISETKQCSFPLPPRTIAKLQAYEKILLKWQRGINLVSRGTLKNIWERHFQDSLQLIPILRSITNSKTAKILDVGSGGGFPGMILSMTNLFDITCLDSDQRKTIFLSEVARQTDTMVKIINSRIEDFKKKEFDIVTARGFAPLRVLIDISKTHTRTGLGIFLKGENVQQEINEAQQYFAFSYKIYPSITNNGSGIVLTRIKHMT